MKLINWTQQPTSLFNDMDRVVRTVFNNNLHSPAIGENWVPAIDIREDDSSFILTADIPGLNKSDIELLVENNTLKISGSRDQKRKNEAYYYQERMHGSFHRSFQLPTTINVENITASFENGILSVILPKNEEAKPKQITIKIK